MSATHYTGSKGPVAIATMAYPHLKSAHAKLLRERVGGERQDELDTMAERLAVLDADFAAQADGDPAPEGTAADEPNPRAVMGANNPPEATPFEAIKAHLDDLLMEARNWADGKIPQTQEQADTINRLADDLRKADAAADAQRIKEKKPLDDQVAAIQKRYNFYLAPLTNKVPGKVPMALDALAKALTPYLKKLEDEKTAIAEALRKEAEAKAAEAAAALREAEPSDLQAREEAEALIDAASRAATVAKQAGNDKAQARGGVRATGLRSYWTPVLTDRRAALLHYLVAEPDAIVTCIQRLAEQDVASGKRSIPGFTVNEERRVA